MAMLFIRHPGGVSHHPDERVETADVAVAIRVLAKLIERLAYEQIAPRRRNEA
jgi:allantoate deiminase